MKVFTTEKINKLLKEEYMGYGVSRSNFFVHQRIGGTRKAGIKFLMTQEELIEWSKCFNDIGYFANNYCNIKLEDGQIGRMELRDYQKKILEFVNTNRYSILFCSRQIGKTAVLAIYFLHMMLFNPDKKILILPNVSMNGKEFIRKLKDIYKLLPFFMKQGIINWSENGVVFENGSRVMNWSPRLNKGTEFIFPDDTDIILLNDMSRYPYHLQEPIYKEIIKKLKEDGRIIIDSAGNGYNFFYELLRDSERPNQDPQKNLFNSMRIYWWQVPGRMDTKITFIEDKMKQFGLNTIDIVQYLYQKYSIYKKGETYFIRYDYNDEKTHIYNIRELKLANIRLSNISTITNWAEEQREIVGEEIFREEYDLQFIVDEKNYKKRNGLQGI